jgi:hypothetical protein
MNHHVMPRRRGRRRGRFQLAVERLEPRWLLTVSSALLNSWFDAGQGEYAQVISGYNVAAGPSTTWPTNVPSGTTYSGGNATPALGDIQKVSYSTNYIYVSSPDLASYVMGPWFLTASGTVFPNFPSNQNETVRITLGSYPSSTHANTTGGADGIAVNGVSIFNNLDYFSYNHNSGQDLSTNGPNPHGDGIWNRDAEYGEKVTFDEGNGHQPGNGEYHYHVDPTALRLQLNDNVDYIGTTNYFPYDPMSYLNHGQGSDGTYREHTTALHHSPIIGWAFDGHPIYGPYGYSDPNNPNSPIKRMVSGFSLRSITTRTSVPGWAAAAEFGASVTPDSTYSLTTTQYGPAVSTTYPLGRYTEDYAYVPGSGDLDQYNGRWTVTPEFPGGVYAYFVTIGSDGSPAFPYVMNRQFYGTINSGKVTNTSGDGTVTTVFDVSTNTAPVVTGPSNASVIHNAALSFSGSNLISMSDLDAAATERITLAVTSGTLSVSLSGALAGGASIVSGANNSSSMTISGGISQINAALATLTYTAPMSGTTATLTAQADDGSAVNHLSNTLSTTLTLINVAPTISGPGAVTVILGSSRHFGDSNLITVADADAAATETLALAVGNGALDVDTSGGAAVVAGANDSSTMTLSGSIAQLNAALATLQYTAPAAGTTDTLTATPNDGITSGSPLNVSITLGSGSLALSGSAFDLRINADGQHLDLWTNSTATGLTSQSVLLSQISSVVITGTPGNDNVVADFTTALAAGDPPALFFDGAGAGSDALKLSGGSITYTSDLATAGANQSMNITSGSITFTNTAQSTIVAWLAAGRLYSSDAGGALGYADPGSGKTKVCYTLDGDTDLNGEVNVADLANLAGNFGATVGATWIQGDMDYNGTVNVADLADLAGNFGQSISSATLASTAAQPAAQPAAVAAAAAPSSPVLVSPPVAFADASSAGWYSQVEQDLRREAYDTGSAV